MPFFPIEIQILDTGQVLSIAEPERLPTGSSFKIIKTSQFLSVGELKEHLKHVPDDTPVCFHSEHHFAKTVSTINPDQLIDPDDTDLQVLIQ